MAQGQRRAQIAHDILNRFYDGDPNGEYALNDTGKPLGDLLLNKTKTKYKEWGCGDAADINADVGREWLAMYVNRSPAKGNPILASTLTIVTGTKDQPANLDGCLHFFGSSAPAMLDDTAYCYRSDNNGMYMYGQRTRMRTPHPPSTPDIWQSPLSAVWLSVS